MRSRRIEWFGPVAVVALVCWPLFLGALGAHPAKFEEVAVGGGTADTVDGGVDLEKDGDITTTGRISSSASTTTRAGLNIPPGAAPTSPVSGDVWTLSTGSPGMYLRIGSTTYGPFGVSTAGDVVGPASSTANAIPTYSDTSGKALGNTAVTIVNDELITPASTTSAAGLRVTPGVAPSSPVNGQLWNTTTGWYGRTNGATLGPFASLSGAVTDTALSAFDGTAGKLKTTLYTVDANGMLVLPASTTTTAFLKLTQGDTPSAPGNGMIWITSAGLSYQANGTTFGPLSTGTGDVTAAANLTDGKIVVGDGGAKGVKTTTVGIDGSGNMTVPGTLSVDGATMTFGDGAGDQTMYLDGGAAQYRRVIMRTDGENRWGWGANQDSESGSDAGSNFVITSYDDDGLPLDDVFKINRAAGDVTIPYFLKLGSGPVTLNNSAGKILDAALEQNGATTGQFKAWDGSTWAPKSRNGVVELSAGGALFPTSNPAVGKDLDANDNMCVEYAASDTAFWQLAVPEDYDGSVESIKVYWSKADTNSVTWSLAVTILSEGDPMNEGTAAGGSNSETPTADDQMITSITDADLLGVEANAGDAIKIYVSTNAFSGTSAFLQTVKIEY